MALLNSRVVRVSTAGVFAGVLIGIVGGAFRYCLLAADRAREALIIWAHLSPRLGWMLPVMLGLVGAALARFLVARFAPSAEGSGVQHVEAAFHGQVQPDPPSIVPVKFVGGLLGIGSGLALGREGPTVQMGAALSRLLSHRIVADAADTRLIAAAGAGAGLAVAFNAPIGGSIFVFEELSSAFTPLLLVATLSAATIAVWITRLILGNTLEFTVPHRGLLEIWQVMPSLGLGALLGAVGALYNAVTVRLLRMSDRMAGVSSVTRAAIIGATVGLVAWFAPALVGGGNALTQTILDERYALAGLATVFLARFLIGPWSYAAAAPGGIFAPLLALGACSGALFADALNHFVPLLALSPALFAVVGMGALFSASVRAPLTGIVLTVEMTGRGDLTLALLAASLAAVLVAMLLGSEPIYETLKQRMLARALPSADTIASGTPPMHRIVGHASPTSRAP